MKLQEVINNLRHFTIKPEEQQLFEQQIQELVLIAYAAQKLKESHAEAESELEDAQIRAEEIKSDMLEASDLASELDSELSHILNRELKCNLSDLEFRVAAVRSDSESLVDYVDELENKLDDIEEWLGDL